MIRKLFNLVKSGNHNWQFWINTGWLIFDKIFHMALSLVVTAMVTRYLGVEQYGLLSYGLAFIDIFTIICKLGIDGIIVNELIKNRDRTGEILGSTTFLRLLSSFLSMILTYIFVKLLNPNDHTILVITCIQSVSLIFVAFDTLNYYWQSRLESKYTAIAQSISYPLVCLLRLLFIWLKKDVTWFAWATVLDAFLIALIMLFFYKREHLPRYKLSISMMKYLLQHSYHFIPVNLLVTIYTQMDKLMIKGMSDSIQVGLYSAAMLVANLWIFIPNALIDSGRPIIMAMKSEKNEDGYVDRLRKLNMGVLWISILAGVFFTIFGRVVIYIVNGKAFLAAVPVLWVLIWSRMFSLMGTTRSIWMLCEGMEKYIKYFVALGAFINVVLNWMLIPILGAVGAAIATLVTEVLSSFVATGIVPKTRPYFKILLRSIKIK
ncbi:MAG: flippase [Lachnospiraceae bacterium]